MQVCELKFQRKPLPTNPFDRRYVVPGGINDLHIVGLSGGADSTFLAIYLKKTNPEVSFIFYSSDTGNEVSSTYEQLDDLETYFGQKILRISADKTLYELIDSYGGFLPSTRARYCTRELKIVPLEGFLERLLAENPLTVIHQYVGLRADEPGRVGYTSHDGRVQTHFPLREMGIVRQDVFTGLSKEFRIPSFYSYRSRSGCSGCYASRKGEFILMAQKSRKDFDEAVTIERLSGVDQYRYQDNPEPQYLSQRKMQWNAFPHPPTWDFDENDKIQIANKAKAKEAKKLSRKPSGPMQFDLLGSGTRSSIWVAVEFSISPSWYWGEPFVSFSEVVAISRSKSGLSKQVYSRYVHKVDTLWQYFDDRDDLNDTLRYVFYEISAPDDRLEVLGPVDDHSYTLHRDWSLKQGKHWLTWAHATLLSAWELGKQSDGSYPLDSNLARVESVDLHKPKEYTLGDDFYDPREDEVSEDGEEEGQFVMCAACSR